MKRRSFIATAIAALVAPKAKASGGPIKQSMADWAAGHRHLAGNIGEPVFIIPPSAVEYYDVPPPGRVLVMPNINGPAWSFEDWLRHELDAIALSELEQHRSRRPLLCPHGVAIELNHCWPCGDALGSQRDSTVAKDRPLSGRVGVSCATERSAARGLAQPAGKAHRKG